MSHESLTLQELLHTYNHGGAAKLSVLAGAIATPSELGWPPGAQRQVSLDKDAMTQAVKDITPTLEYVTPEAFNGLVEFIYDAGLDAQAIGQHYKNENVFRTPPRPDRVKIVRGVISDNSAAKESYYANLEKRATLLRGFQKGDTPLYSAEELHGQPNWEVSQRHSRDWNLALAYVDPKQTAENYNRKVGYDLLLKKVPAVAISHVEAAIPKWQEAGVYDAIVPHLHSSIRPKEYTAPMRKYA